MKYLTNLLSILAGKRFAKAYHLNPFGRKAKGWLNVYIGLRQTLPIISQNSRGILTGESNHWGNHVGSGCKPYLATQGKN